MPAIAIPATLFAQSCNPFTDTDGDFVNDCLDACPFDPYKAVSAGPCGCGNYDDDYDSDRDGVINCRDVCPYEPTKTYNQGACGCGEPFVGIGVEVDSDRDGTPDCIDQCYFDPTKTQPGQCGCGIPEESCVEFVLPDPIFRVQNVRGGTSILLVSADASQGEVDYPEGGYTVRLYLKKGKAKRNIIVESHVDEMENGANFEVPFTIVRRKYASVRKQGSGKIELCYTDIDPETDEAEVICSQRPVSFTITRKGIIKQEVKAKKRKKNK